MSYFKHDLANVSDDAEVGDETRVWANVSIMGGAKVGSHCNVCNGTYIEGGAVVGNHVTIKHNVSIFDGVTIGNDVFIGSNIAFINDRYPRSNRTDGWTLEKTNISDGATLGANAVIMCGLTVGKYAVVGAGSVVTRNVPDHAIVAGNPAKIIGYAGHDGVPLDKNYKCKSTGKQYVMTDKGLKLDE